MKEFKFNELKENFPRGTDFPSGVNALPRAALSGFKNPLAENVFANAEQNRSFGTLKFPEDKPEFKASFRWGVCDRLFLYKRSSEVVFENHILNDAVYFGKGK